MIKLVTLLKPSRHVNNAIIEALDNHQIPTMVYHGGDCSNLKSLYNNFTILGSDDKRKHPSTGGGFFGLSTSMEKSIAIQYSSILGCAKVLSIHVRPTAKILFVNTGGDGLDELYTYDDMHEFAIDGYDAILDTHINGEREVRILRPSNFNVNKIEL